MKAKEEKPRICSANAGAPRGRVSGLLERNAEDNGVGGLSDV